MRIFNLRGGAHPERVVKTGIKVKEHVKETVSEAASTLKRGVGEGVSDVAEAVKVRSTRSDGRFLLLVTATGRSVRTDMNRVIFLKSVLTLDSRKN